MTHTMIGFIVLIIATFAITLILLCIEYFRHKQSVEWNTYINEAKEALEKAGFIFNHSYRLTHKETGKTSYIRIFAIKYSPDKKKVMVHAYMLTKDGEIGTWYDDCNYLLDIYKRWNIEDCGEWNPD